MLGGFPRATIRVIAMNRNTCMESRIAPMALRKPSYTGINSSQVVVSANRDRYLLKNEDCKSQLLFL